MRVILLTRAIYIERSHSFKKCLNALKVSTHARETLRANYFTKAKKFNLIRQTNISNDNDTVLVLNLEPRVVSQQQPDP